ncbi:hypothetical protein ACFCYX_07685 [Streptomyces populi]|uniref:hypothetical protein n=1 Tax=Streptomyces populi TaxID=2058924 RepID=UPI0013A68F5A|nr:hypothetical protein [Streptomyces populi]
MHGRTRGTRTATALGRVLLLAARGPTHGAGSPGRTPVRAADAPARLPVPQDKGGEAAADVTFSTAAFLSET